MDEREITCCFTGHRPMHLPWGSNEGDARCQALLQELSARLTGIYEAGYRRFLCVMALGCDTFFAEAVLALRDERPDVRLEAAIPCEGQSDRWNAAQKARYDALLRRCDAVTVLQKSYTPDCMQRRNRYMVDRSSLLLACYNGSPGGTRNTLLYAMREQVKVITIDI